MGNMAMLSMLHARNPAVDAAYAARLINYGHHQANYLLGDAGRSWVVGFGKDYPQYLNHKMVCLTSTGGRLPSRARRVCPLSVY